MSLPPGTISSVPIADFAMANVELAEKETAHFYSCCGKSVCRGCIYSFNESGNTGKCPFCKSDQIGETDLDRIEELKKRMEVNDAGAIYICWLSIIVNENKFVARSCKGNRALY
jgi:hypothetical protein